jgi:hypothetical protein
MLVATTTVITLDHSSLLGKLVVVVGIFLHGSSSLLQPIGGCESHVRSQMFKAIYFKIHKEMNRIL